MANIYDLAQFGGIELLQLIVSYIVIVLLEGEPLLHHPRAVQPKTLLTPIKSSLRLDRHLKRYTTIIWLTKSTNATRFALCNIKILSVTCLPLITLVL